MSLHVVDNVAIAYFAVKIIMDSVKEEEGTLVSCVTRKDFIFVLLRGGLFEIDYNTH